MKKLITILPLLFVTVILFAQDSDLVFVVKKKKDITIEPDDMHLQAGSASTFTIKGIPAGYSVRGSFNGARVRINADGTFTLEPENKGGKPYLTDLQISVYNSEGDAMILNRTCYVGLKSNRSPMTTQQLSSLPTSAAPRGSTNWKRVRATPAAQRYKGAWNQE